MYSLSRITVPLLINRWTIRKVRHGSQWSMVCYIVQVGYNLQLPRGGGQGGRRYPYGQHSERAGRGQGSMWTVEMAVRPCWRMWRRELREWKSERWTEERQRKKGQGKRETDTGADRLKQTGAKKGKWGRGGEDEERGTINGKGWGDQSSQQQRMYILNIMLSGDRQITYFYYWK